MCDPKLAPEAKKKNNFIMGQYGVNWQNLIKSVLRVNISVKFPDFEK